MWITTREVAAGKVHSSIERDSENAFHEMDYFQDSDEAGKCQVPSVEVFALLEDGLVPDPAVVGVEAAWRLDDQEQRCSETVHRWEQLGFTDYKPDKPKKNRKEVKQRRIEPDPLILVLLKLVLIISSLRKIARPRFRRRLVRTLNRYPRINSIWVPRSHFFFQFIIKA